MVFYQDSGGRNHLEKAEEKTALSCWHVNPIRRASRRRRRKDWFVGIGRPPKKQISELWIWHYLKNAMVQFQNPLQEKHPILLIMSSFRFQFRRERLHGWLREAFLEWNSRPYAGLKRDGNEIPFNHLLLSSSILCSMSILPCLNQHFLFRFIPQTSSEPC